MAMAVRIGSVGRVEGFSLQNNKNLVGEGVVRKDACGVAFRHHHQHHQHRRGAARAALMQTAPLPMSSVATKLRLPAFLSIFLRRKRFLSSCSRIGAPLLRGFAGNLII
jgi:hypothetical protein